MYQLPAFLLTLLLFSNYSAQAQTPVTPNPDWQIFESHSFTHKDKTMPYRLLQPKDYDPNKSYPLIVFLHGAGERGTDNEIPLTHIAPVVLTDEQRANYAAFVLVPQCPTEYRWVETDWKLSAHTQPTAPSIPMEMLMQLLQQTQNEYSIDKSRCYVMGLSMGGFGTWDILTRMPDFFAAAAPICGGADLAQASALKDMPIWVFHGDKDKVVLTSRSRDMVKALKTAGSTAVHYTEYKDVGHGSWKPALLEKELWKWLFEQRKP